jgi:hypothetical protein
VGERSHLLDHVEHPDDVGIVLAGQLLVLERAVVLLVLEPADVDRHDLSAIRREIGNLAHDERRGSRR